MEVLQRFPVLNALRQPHPDLRAVLFDMDGTLLRTEELHAQALRDMSSAWGLTPPFPPEETETRLKGLADRQVVALARHWPGFPPGMDEAGFVREKNARLLEMIPRLAPELWGHPDLATFLAEARLKGLLTGLVTSSEDVVTRALLSAAGLANAFDIVLTFQDVRHPKPHPEPYLRAMLGLGVGPRETLVFEDSAPGIASARESGARVVRADWWR